MRSLTPRAVFALRSALPLAIVALASTGTFAHDGPPLPAAEPSATNNTDLQRAGTPVDTPKVAPPSTMKPVPPLFDPSKETIFTTSTYRKPSRLKVGIYAADSTSLRRATDPIYVAFGASLDLPPRGVPQPFTPEVYLDSAYFNTTSGDSAQAFLVGGGLGFRFYPGVKPGFTTQRPHLFVGAGVGLYYLHTDLGTKQDDTQLGGKVSAGVDFAAGWTFETNYTLVGKSNGTDFSGPMALLSYRF
jgi:hypothetical protein